MDDRDIIRSFESVSSRRVVIVLAVVAVAVAILIGLVVSSFRNRHISRSADAVTNSVMSGRGAR